MKGAAEHWARWTAPAEKNQPRNKHQQQPQFPVVPENQPIIRAWMEIAADQWDFEVTPPRLNWPAVLIVLRVSGFGARPADLLGIRIMERHVANYRGKLAAEKQAAAEQQERENFFAGMGAA